MIQVNNVYTFIMVVERGGFSEAAKKLKVTPTAVSKNITNLENELGLILFHRTTRSIKLTDNGKLIYDKAKLALASVGDIKNLAATLQHRAAGTLRISSPISIGNHILIPILEKYLVLNPETSIDLELQDHTRINFGKDNVDILFGRTMNAIVDQEKNVVGNKLFATDNVLCAATQYLKKYGHPKQLADLSSHNYIYHKSRIEDKFLEKCREDKVTINIKLLVDSTETLVKAIEYGIGIGYCPTYIIEESLKKKQIVALNSIYEEQPLILYMFYRKSRYQERKIVEFKNFIVNNIIINQ